MRPGEDERPGDRGVDLGEARRLLAKLQAMIDAHEAARVIENHGENHGENGGESSRERRADGHRREADRIAAETAKRRGPRAAIERREREEAPEERARRTWGRFENGLAPEMSGRLAPFVMPALAGIGGLAALLALLWLWPSPPPPTLAAPDPPPRRPGFDRFDRSAALEAILRASPELAETRTRPAGPSSAAIALRWPTRGRLIAPFGARETGAKLDGIRIFAPLGAEVRAAAAGEVVFAGRASKELGGVVVIAHPGGIATTYAHLDPIEAKLGRTVRAGERLGAVGPPIGAPAANLYFDLRVAGRPIDPLEHLGHRLLR